MPDTRVTNSTWNMNWIGNRSTTLCLLRETKLEITDVGEMNMNPTSIHVHKSIDPAGLQLKLKLNF